MDAIVAIIVLAIAINLLVAMIQPYAPYIVIGCAVFLAGGVLMRRYRRF